MKKSLALLAASLTLGVSAHAQSTYVDMAYQTLDSGLSTDPAVERITAGYIVHPNFAVEGMLGVNAKNGKEAINGYTVSVKVDNLVGIYLRPMYALSDSVEIYGRLGYARLKATASVQGYKASESDSDFSYGVGLAYSVNKTVRIFADYTRISSSDAMAVGVGFKF